MVDYPDVLHYTRDELIEEFCKLFDRHQELTEVAEADTQKIHELKRALDTATAAEAYLSQELEQYTNADTTQNENELQKNVSELAELKKKYVKLEQSFGALQQDYNTLLDENLSLSQSLREATRRRDATPAAVQNHTSEEDLRRMQMLELENEEMLMKIEEFQERTVRFTMAIGEFEKNNEILRDQNNCLEENLQSKRDDLEEKIQILESTQEQLAEANAKIALLSSAQETDDRKGNSLFAEVDDQRQVMRKLLAAQKQNYVQMKNIYNESEHEIRRLKRENVAMQTELESCSSIFCNADRVYQDKLNERIRHLLKQNEELEHKLNWAQERMREMASEKGVLWLDSMLSLCKKETDDLKKQLHSVRLQNANLEEQLRNSQQDMVRWRFESLKSRCVLLDREQLLTENKIIFKPVKAIEFRITKKQENESRPRIVSTRRSSTLENMQRMSLTPLQVVHENANTAQVQDVANNEVHKKQANCNKDENSSIHKSPQDTQDKETKKHASADINNVSLEFCTNGEDEHGGDKNNNDTNLQDIRIDEQTEDKENCFESSYTLNSKFSKLELNPPSPMRPSQRASKTTPHEEEAFTPPARSILTKQRDIYSKDTWKSVQFSSKEDLIHQLSPSKTPSPASCEKSPSSSILMCNNNVGKAAKASTCQSAKSSKAVVKESRPKSGIVVRRIVIESKRD